MNQYNSERFRLRPSVSLTPLQHKGRYQFFLSDIRQSFSMDFTHTIYVDILLSLDGSLTFTQVIKAYRLQEQQACGLEKLFTILIERCVVEEVHTVQSRIEDPFRRVKNFIASYVPYYHIEPVWTRLINSHAVIIGVGGVGSWVALLLGQLGIKYFTLLDDDIVKPHNLNRSIFCNDDIGLLKTRAAERMLAARKSQYYAVESITEKLSNSSRLINFLHHTTQRQTVLINCADFPSVAQTSAIIHDAAFTCNLPYIIAGGYNMHLSLVGPTVIPGETPCFHCIAYAMNQVGVDDLAGAERIVKEHRNIGNIAPLAAISASFVANECLKLLVGMPYMQPIMQGKRGEFNFLTKKLALETYERWDECPYCGKK